jgi:hypothetical protein
LSLDLVLISSVLANFSFQVEQKRYRAEESDPFASRFSV